jgi:CheY-like chemotaxis protein
MTAIVGSHILFVDDRFDIANMYISRVRGEGAEVSYESKLLGALEALSTESFDLAIVDLHMPLPPPPWPSFCRSSIEALANNASYVVRSHNLGQMIGHYINTQRNGRPPFMYLSAVASYFEEIAEARIPAGLSCLDRYKTTPADLVATITSYFQGAATGAA